MGLLNFLTKVAITKKAVPAIIAKPGRPSTNDIPGRGNAFALIRVSAVNAIAIYIGMVKSLLKKGSAIKNSDIWEC